MATKNTIYISMRDTSNSSSEYSLIAIQAKDGELLWRNFSPIEIEATQIIIEHDILYVLSKSHSLLEVNSIEARRTDNGALLWHHRIEGLGSGPPVMDQGILYTCCFAPHGIHALRANDGDLLWSYQFDQDVTHCAALNGMVYIALHPESDANRGALVVLRASDGMLLWRQPVDREITALAANDEFVYVGLTDKTRLEAPYVLDALRISDGTPLWRHHSKRGLVRDLKMIDGVKVIYSVNGKDMTSLVVPWTNAAQARATLEKPKGPDSMITSSNEGGVVALNAREGTVLWEYNGLDLGSVSIADEKLYISSASGIRILHPDTGKLLKRYQIGSSVTDILVADMIYSVIQDSTTSLKALRKGDGTVLWRTEFDPSSIIITITMGIPASMGRQEHLAAERPHPKETNPLITKANKALVNRLFEEVLNKGDMAVAEELLDINYISYRDGYFPGLPSGLKGFKHLFSLFRAAFPDGHLSRFEIQSHYAEEDLVTVHYEWHGSYTGVFMELLPTGDTFSFVGVSLIRIANGKVVESWHSFDSFAACILGVIAGYNALK